MAAPDTRLPLLITLLCVIIGSLIGVAGGSTISSVVGAVVAALGAIPACWGIWLGMQQQTQTSLLGAILLLFLALGTAGLLLVLRLVDWIA